MERRQPRSLTEEYRRQAVELVLGHKTAIALDQIGAAAMIGADDLQQILRVEPCRECCLTDEVAEHDRQLPALGGIVWPRLGHSGRLRREQGVTRKLAALPFPFRQVSKGQRTCPIAPEQLKRGHRSKVRNGSDSDFLALIMLTLKAGMPRNRTRASRRRENPGPGLNPTLPACRPGL
jgi:hypothetical protein